MDGSRNGDLDDLPGCSGPKATKGKRIMQHFTCDMCGKLLDEQRFVATVDVYPAFDPDELTEADLDLDHLQEVADALEHGDGLNLSDDDHLVARTLKFDLCPACHVRYVRDPLGKQNRRPMHFSEN